MHIFKRTSLILIVIVLLFSQLSFASTDDDAKPYTITATIYNEQGDQYGITFRSIKLYREPKIQVIKKGANIDFSKAMIFDAFYDDYSSYEPDFIFKGVVKGLDHDTDYFYRVGDARSDTWSEVCSFHTTPKGNKDFTFLFMLDTQGPGERWGHVLNKAFELFPDARFILHTGDMVDYGLDETQWRNMLWDNRQYTANTLIASVSGTYHEDRGSELYTHFHRKLPANQKVDKGYFYSFDYSNAHILMLDVTDIGADYKFSEKQIEWIKKDLARTNKKWRIVALHWSIYSSGPHSYYELEQLDNLRKQVEPIFDLYNVDLVLQGHDHVYTITKSLVNGEVQKNKTIEREFNGVKYKSILNQKGTVYITGGTSGTKYYDHYNFERFDHIFDVRTSFKNSTFTAITVTANDLIVQSYNYDEVNDTATLYITFGFTRYLLPMDVLITFSHFMLLAAAVKQFALRRFRVKI